MDSDDEIPEDSSTESQKRRTLSEKQLKEKALCEKRRREFMTSDQKNKEAERKRFERQRMTSEQRQRESERKRNKRRNMTSSEVETERTSSRRKPNSSSESAMSENARKRKRVPPSKYIARNNVTNVEKHSLGQKNVSCLDCGAFHFDVEKTCRKKFSDCCGSGIIDLQQLNVYPQQFKLWLTEDSADAKHFRAHIRKYNSAFAFASFGHQTVKLPMGPQVFVIHGQVYHITAQSLGNGNTYAKLYILDPEFANEERASNVHNDGCRQEFFSKIDATLRVINPFIEAYRMMSAVANDVGKTHDVKMWITKDRQHDKRVYNLPVANEVAAVFVSEDGEPPFERDIAVYPTGCNDLQNISILSPNWDPMTYPLLFPHGDSGWQRGIPKVSAGLKERNLNDIEVDVDDTCTSNVSMLQFYSFRLQERGSFNPLLHAGKLTQQFMVDAFLKIEGQRIQWNRLNQKKLRVDLYMGLMDYVNSQAEKQHLRAGRIVILPSSFTGSKRYMHQIYQDAMVLVANFGKPDLFITFTCNPKWPEITSNLNNHETAIDRPDLVATVFYLKLKEFLNDVANINGGVLGRVKAYLWVIEFQKRGLPHCHMLFILNDEDKLRQPEDVDSVVSAEIPDPDLDKELYEIIKTCMLHGPCGSII